MYSFEDYNEHDVLKIPLILVLIDLYLLKHILIFVLPIISSIPFLVNFAHKHFSLFLLLSTLPAALVMVAIFRRVPQTRSIFILWIWRQGRILLLTSLLLEFCLIILFILLDLKKINEVSLIFIYVDVLLMIFIVKSQRIRDVFREFPQRSQKTQ